jgi:hypothetical protein
VANGINSRGDIVGSVHTPDGERAVLWDADTLTVTDLNTLFNAPALGWELQWASRINDDGLIAGTGQLDGNFRGFVLDRSASQILEVPLAEPAHSNVVNQINSEGHVVGSMWDGIGDANNFNPDFYSAYLWVGAGSDPVLLASATDNTSTALGQNDRSQIVGVSLIPSDDIFDDDTVATLWEADASGVFQAINLREEIPNKPEYRLEWAWDINNDGWIGVSGRKFHKGRYSRPTLILVPNSATSSSLTAVPEPSAAFMAFIAVAAIAARRTRKSENA